MKVFKSSDKFGITSYFETYMDVLEEFKAFLDNAMTGDVMTYEILEMTDDEFSNLTKHNT
jgi:hypothetical protein